MSSNESSTNTNNYDNIETVNSKYVNCTEVPLQPYYITLAQNEHHLDASNVKLCIVPELSNSGIEGLAQGDRIYVAPGNENNTKIILHEIAHIAQQAKGDAPSEPIVQDPSLERDAEKSANKSDSNVETGNKSLLKPIPFQRAPMQPFALSAAILSGIVLGVAAVGAGIATLVHAIKKRKARQKVQNSDGSLISTKTSNKIDNRTIGICNLGNSCYMNSAIQTLYNNTKFRNLVLNTDFIRKENVALKAIFTLMHKTNKKTISCDEVVPLYSALGYTGAQADSHELIMTITNGVSEELEPLGNHAMQDIFPPQSFHFSFESNDEIRQALNGGSNLVINVFPGSDNIKSEYKVVGNNKYRLKSVVIFLGDTQYGLGGHYYSYLRHGNTWIKANDDIITKHKSFKDISYDINQHATTLYYEKV